MPELGNIPRRGLDTIEFTCVTGNCAKLSAALEMAENKEANRRRQIALVAIVGDLANKIRHCHFPTSGYFLHAVPEGQAHAGLVAGDRFRTDDDFMERSAQILETSQPACKPAVSGGNMRNSTADVHQSRNCLAVKLSPAEIDALDVAMPSDQVVGDRYGQAGAWAKNAPK
jgi:hypothetical protein